MVKEELKIEKIRFGGKYNPGTGEVSKYPAFVDTKEHSFSLSGRIKPEQLKSLKEGQIINVFSGRTRNKSRIINKIL